MKKLQLLVLLACGAALFGGNIQCVSAQPAEVPVFKPLLHPLFAQGAVLQRDRAIPVWGWAAPDQSVALALDGKTQQTRAGKDGRWTVSIGPIAAGGPHILAVQSGDQKVERGDILFGDVWLCSGQSNMQMHLNEIVPPVDNAAAEIAAANYPQIRFLRMEYKTSFVPRDTMDATWHAVSPQTANDFSAVAYFFGRDLNRALQVPIGLIDASWGGTAIDGWMSETSLAPLPEAAPDLARLEARKTDGYADRMARWWTETAEKGEAADFARADFSDQNWKTMALPQVWERSGDPDLANFDGFVWFRRTINVPPAFAGRDLSLFLNNIDDADTTFWNGGKIGETFGAATPRKYAVAGAKVKAGVNTLAVRVLDQGGTAGIASGGLALELDFASLAIS